MVSKKIIYCLFEIEWDFGLKQFLLNQPFPVQSTKVLPPLGQRYHDIVHPELKITKNK